jgi:hypothetical protein
MTQPSYSLAFDKPDDLNRINVFLSVIRLQCIIMRKGEMLSMHFKYVKFYASPLSLNNKLLIYKTVLKPIWTYGLQIWGCTAASNLAVIQRYQAKTLRQITNARWYVTNRNLHTDLRIPPVKTALQELTETHHTTLKLHPNPLIATILAPPPRRRLSRRWTLDVNP